MAKIAIKNLTYYYPDAKKPALCGIDLEVAEGEFVLLVGGSGSGKSTLLRAIAGLIPHFYGGSCRGEVYVDGQELCALDRRSLVQKIGMVFQNPENQLVMTEVEQELVFGLENLGLPGELMKRRIMEVSGALGLSPFLHRFIPELSGGQKQKTAIAAILAMQPEVLLLDEPTSQLDPVTGEEVINLVKRLNEENGLTVILAEHRLERCFHLADRVLCLDQGKIVFDHHDQGETARWLVNNNSPFTPPLAKIFGGAGFKRVPLTVKEGRELIKSSFSLTSGAADFGLPALPGQRESSPVGALSETACLVEMENVWFNYPGGSEVLKGVNLQLKNGDFIALMGENAAGKTTLLKMICGLHKPGRGKVKVAGRDTRGLKAEEVAGTVAYLSQEPDDHLFLPTVREELAFTLRNLGLPDEGRIEKTLRELGIEGYAGVNPRQLSVGERQRVALASVLVAEPRVLLLDEPTRGLDYALKNKLGESLLRLQKKGTAILLVTHDVEFAAEFAQEVVLLFAGEIVASGSKYEILTRSAFYASQASKLFYGINDRVVTQEEAKQALRHLREKQADGGR